MVCALLLHCVSLITNGAWMHFSCWSALINIQRWQVDICKEDLHWPSCCASVRLPYSALCWMLLPVLPRECICVSKGTDCSVTLCCCQECRQCGWMSLHPSAHSRTGCCRASIHPSQWTGLEGVGVVLVAPCGGLLFGNWGLNGTQLYANSNDPSSSFSWLLSGEAVEEKAVLPRHPECCQLPVSPRAHAVLAWGLLQPARQWHLLTQGALKKGRLLLQRLLAVTLSPLTSPSEAMAAGVEIH